AAISWLHNRRRSLALADVRMGAQLPLLPRAGWQRIYAALPLASFLTAGPSFSVGALRGVEWVDPLFSRSTDQNDRPVRTLRSCSWLDGHHGAGIDQRARWKGEKNSDCDVD